MTFDELHRSLLLRPEYGMLKHRKSIEREIWNCALDAAIKECEGQAPGFDAFTLKVHKSICESIASQIEKLKV